MTSIHEQIAAARPLEDVIQLLAHEDRSWLEPFLRLSAHAGERAGYELRARLRPAVINPAPGPRAATIRIDPATVVVENGSIEMPFLWESRGYRCVSPHIEGRIIITRQDGGAVVAIDATYEPPAPVTGDLDDTLVAHHASQVAIHDLLRNLQTAIDADSSDSSTLSSAF
jgi:hypothetical protein